MANIDFKLVIVPLSAYYDANRTRNAVGSLENFYYEEEFEKSGIADDWTPNDFDNCQGIHVFVGALNYSEEQVNNETNKQILFEWFCYWLLPNQLRPSDKPWSDFQQSNNQQNKPSNVTIEQRPLEMMRHRFEKVLLDQVYEAYRAEPISKCFMKLCIDQQAGIDDLRDDFDEEEGIDNSLIFEKFMEMDEMQKYQQMKSRFFELLCMIIHEKDYVSFNLDSFETNPSEQNFSTAEEICLEKIGNLLPGKENWRMQLIQAKALDVENNFPLLSCIMDTFYRFVMDKNEQYWEQNMPNSKHNTFDPQFDKPFASKWFTESGYYNHKISTMSAKEADQFGCLGDAIEIMQKRELKYIKLNYKQQEVPIIYDSLDVFVKYYCAMNRFLFRFTTSIVNDHGDYLPIQFDVCIIPRLVKTNVYNEDDEKEESVGIIQSFGKNNQQMGEIWNLETCLNESGYIKGRDYWTGLGDIERIDKEIPKLWQKVVESRNANLKNMRYERFILMVDRRNPQHILNKQMVDDTDDEQKWTDKMYLIIPKEANEIAKEYDNVLNETFIANTEKYLFPIPGMEVNGIRQDLGGLESANGYKFMVSYHLYNKNKAKMYWSYGAGATRFFMNDIEWLWPRYFNAHKNGCFQTLSPASKNVLNDAINEYALRDSQFYDFRRQFEAFDE